MTDEDTLSQAAAKAARAQSLLGNELLTESFAALESAYIAAWRSTTVDDEKGREKLYLAINIIGKVQGHLTTVVNDGKIAAAQLRDLAKIAQKSSST